MARIAIATIKSWNISNYHIWAKQTEHKNLLIQTPDELSSKVLEKFEPDYIFFPHWSYKIPAEVYEKYECVVFHMTDLPFGRGGSPLQNLISRKLYETKISALRVVEAMDAGPIYLKRPLFLYGSATEIYIRASQIIFDMLDEIVELRLQPVAQTGEIVEFARRKPAESQILNSKDLIELYDFIRMLDAESYPSAFLVHEGIRYEFTRATLRDGYIMADVKISLTNALEKIK